MRLNYLIKRLQKIQKKRGNLKVELWVRDSGPNTLTKVRVGSYPDLTPKPESVFFVWHPGFRSKR